VHLFGLPNTMAPVLCLLVHGGVPVRVIEDHTVCACQVDADAAATRRRYETKDLLVQVELVHHSLPHLYLH
jgi:hypothetical protein